MNQSAPKFYLFVFLGPLLRHGTRIPERVEHHSTLHGRFKWVPDLKDNDAEAEEVNLEVHARGEKAGCG